ncbi:hypothetical protein [Frankia sp. CiP3]|nr:hypothetical protein [Frankia sp. CiP3]
MRAVPYAGWADQLERADDGKQLVASVTIFLIRLLAEKLGQYADLSQV